MYAFGFIERKTNGEEIMRKLRLERLQEVRMQDQLLTRQRARSYRDIIDEKKRAKKSMLRAQKMSSMKSLHDQLAKQWRKSLVDTGEAQRASKLAALNTVRREEEASKEVARTKKVESVRRKQAFQKVHEVVAQKQKIEVDKVERRQAVVELQASNREDARRAQEARAIRVRMRTQSPSALAKETGPLIIKQGPAGQSSSSIRMQQSGPQEVKAAVMKHGATMADVSVVKNSAAKEESVCFKKVFSMVVQEMKNRTKAKARARVAVKTTALTKNQDTLENELQLLHTLDRSGSRLTRVKTTSAVPPNEEAPAVTQAFENAFLARQKAEMDVLDIITNDSESVISVPSSTDASETDSVHDKNAEKKGVGFDVAESSGEEATKHLNAKHNSLLERRMKEAMKDKKVHEPPKVSFRSASNKMVAPKQVRGPILSTIPQQALIPQRTYNHETSVSEAAHLRGSIEIGQTTAVSTGVSAEDLTFTKQAPPPIWSAATQNLFPLHKRNGPH